MEASKNDIKEFYDSFAGDKYLREIKRFGVCYDEMVSNIIDLALISHPETILDIGCGVGNIDQILLEKLSNAKLHGLDLSEEMVETSKERNKVHGDRVAFTSTDVLKFETEENYDLVVSNLMMHNLDLTSKRALLAKVRGWLSPDGIFVWGDFMTWKNKSIEQYCMERRKSLILATGVDPDFVEEVLKKEAQDHRLTVTATLDLMKESGFQDVEVHWVNSFLAVLHGKASL